MKNESNSLKAVLFALGANLSIAAIKYIVSVISGSSAMFAEAIHSLADTTNKASFYRFTPESPPCFAETFRQS